MSNPSTLALQPGMNARQWAMLFTLGALWGGSFFFARIAVMEIPPFSLVLFRVAIAAAALHVYLLAAGPSFRMALPYAGSFLILGLINNVLPFSLMFAGQTELGAGLAAVINATTPFWTMILANIVTADEKITRAKFAGISLGIAGTAIMIGPGVVAGLGGPVWAKLALIGTALSYAVALLFARRFRSMPSSIVATGQMTASTFIMIPIVLAWHGSAGLFDASPASWAAVFGLALLSTALAYILYFSLVAEAGSTNASLVTFIVPVGAILLGAVFLGERLESFEIAGMAFIAIGLVIIDGRVFAKR